MDGMERPRERARADTRCMGQILDVKRSFQAAARQVGDPPDDVLIPMCSIPAHEHGENDASLKCTILSGGAVCPLLRGAHFPGRSKRSRCCMSDTAKLNPIMPGKTVRFCMGRR